MRHSIIPLCATLIFGGCVSDAVEPVPEMLQVTGPSLFAGDQFGMANGGFRDTVEVFTVDSSAFELEIDRIDGDASIFNVAMLTSGTSKVHRLEVVADTTIPAPAQGQLILSATAQLIGKSEGKRDATGSTVFTYVRIRK